jgi:N-methylhydantoinase A
VIAAFDQLHEELYGFAIPGHPHEVLSLRAAAIGPIPEGHELAARRFPRGTGASATTPEPREIRSVWDEVVGDFAPTAVFVRDDLEPGGTLQGPCLVEGMDAVVWIPSDCVVAVRESGALVVSFDAVPGESRSGQDV